MTELIKAQEVQNRDNIETKYYQISPSDPHRAREKDRDDIKINVHVFKGWHLISPQLSAIDPMMKILQPFRKGTAAAGSVAASSSEINSVESVIKQINREVESLPDVNNCYNFNDYVEKLNYSKLIFFQPNGLWFNDGSLIAFNNELIDEPLNTLKEEYEQKDFNYSRLIRNFIGTDYNRNNIYFTASSYSEVKKEIKEKKLNIVISASPAFIQRGAILNTKTFFSSQMMSDLRHYLTLPYFNGEPLLLPQLVNMIRIGEGAQIAHSLEGHPLRIPFKRLTKDTVSSINHTFQKHPVYGKDFIINYDRDNIVLEKGIKRGVYNHLLFGINKKSELVMIQTSGTKLIGDKLITGQEGITWLELNNFLQAKKNELNLECLFSACQGRDANHILSWTQETNKVTDNLLISNSRFNLGPSANRGKITSPRIMIGM